MAEVGSYPSSELLKLSTNMNIGLQCHTTPYSWKIVFECDCQLYEMMLTACTPKEEDEWRSRLEIVSALAAQEQVGGPELHSSLFLNLKSLGTVFGKQGECI